MLDKLRSGKNEDIQVYATRDKKLGQMLVERGRITGEQLIRAIRSQRMVGGRLGTCLPEMDVLDEDTLLDALSDQLQVPSVRVEQMRAIRPETVALLPAKVASRCLAETDSAAERTQPALLQGLDEVDRLLGMASDPHQVADVMLRYAMARLHRAALFSVRPESSGHRFRGWKIRGEGTDSALFTSFQVSSTQTSVFAEIDPETPWRLGGLAPLPIHRKLASCWGGEFPETCLLVPVALRGRMACLLYGDRGSEDLGRVDPNDFRRLALEAAMAFELCILRKKIQDV